MSLVRRLLSGGRIREARALLAHEPSAANYAALAHEHVRLSEMAEALRVCEEGLASFPGNAELERLADRARELALGDRTRELARQLRESPRPALYRELCAILLQSRRTTRAEELAQEWFEKTGDGQAQLVRAEARLQRFFADRRREDARLALELLDAAEQLFPNDERPLRLRLSLASRAGAWREAQRVVARLLELEPGDPVLEARFRTLATLAETAPPLDQALREVERTGRLVDDEPDRALAPPSPSSIRPRLKALAAQGGVQGAIYERGSTALVQGAKGATAERSARSIREVVQKSRTAARRLGLGAASEVLLEGDFGSLLIAPAEAGSAAVWCTGEIGERHRRALRELVGGVAADDLEEGA